MLTITRFLARPCALRCEERSRNLQRSKWKTEGIQNILEMDRDDGVCIVAFYKHTQLETEGWV